MPIDTTPTFHGEPMADVVWRAEDVKTLRQDWPMERCEEELAKVEKHLRDRVTELGWEVLDDLLSMADENETTDQSPA